MENILPLFIEEMRSDKKHMSFTQGNLWEVYWHLFKMLNYYSPLALDYTYQECLKCEDWKKDNEEEKGNWFWSFHKSIRQRDLFDNASMQITPENPLTEEEEARYQELRKQYIDSREHMNDYEWCSDEYHRADAEWKIANRELRSEYAKLSNKREVKDTVSISGHLDSILWNTIHVDKENVLYKTLDRFFDDIRTGYIKIPREQHGEI